MKRKVFKLHSISGPWVVETTPVMVWELLNWSYPHVPHRQTYRTWTEALGDAVRRADAGT